VQGQSGRVNEAKPLMEHYHGLCIVLYMLNKTCHLSVLAKPDRNVHMT
jgi:hypothetical protein